MDLECSPAQTALSKEDATGPGRAAGMGRRTERFLLAVVLLCAAGLRLWHLDQNGYGNSYYAAAVRSMLADGRNFFFGSFDPAGFITVDKPPVAVWIQAASAAVFGYSGLSLLLPQALIGVASVFLTYLLVRRTFGAAAGLLAGLVLALMPVSVAVDRDNLPDTALVLTLLLAAWALLRAAETGRLRPLLLAAALVGVGFNIKMLAAFVVLPAFYLVYFAGAPVRWRTRLGHLTAATGIIAAVSLSWSAAVELTPQDRRPYIGGSHNNSALELALGYNGLGRIFGGSGNFGPPGGGPPPSGGQPDRRPPGPPKDWLPDGGPNAARTGASNKGEEQSGQGGGKSAQDGDRLPPWPGADSPPSAGSRSGLPPPAPGTGSPPWGPGPPNGPLGGPGGGPGRFGANPGFLRFAGLHMAGQITWLFPLALVGAVVTACRARRHWPLAPAHLALLLWAGWLGTHWVVFSFARGIFHEYYTTVMGPALATLAGAGVVALWQVWLRGGWRIGLFPLALLLTAAWQGWLISQYPELRYSLLPALLAIAGAGLAVLAVHRLLAGRWKSVPWGKLGFAAGFAGMLIGPAAWSLAVVLVPGNAVMPAADPSPLIGRRDRMRPPMGPGMETRGTDKLVDFLRANRREERILVAAAGSMEVAPIIIHTGEPAVALGGFMGADKVVTEEQFGALVQEGQVRFVLVDGGPPGGPGGFGRGDGPRDGNGVRGSPPIPAGGPPMPAGGPPGMGGPGGRGNAEVIAWVRKNATPVDAKLWQFDEPPAPALDGGPPGRPGPPPGGFGRGRGMRQLYDCRPELGWVDSAAR
jgi:4-amino-4-deoxy-L-arabinose transferase-like glycosyltransferase